jgi:hypothetical protein
MASKFIIFYPCQLICYTKKRAIADDTLAYAMRARRIVIHFYATSSKADPKGEKEGVTLLN